MIFYSKSVIFVKVSGNLKRVSWYNDYKNSGFCFGGDKIKECQRVVILHHFSLSHPKIF